MSAVGFQCDILVHIYNMSRVEHGICGTHFKTQIIMEQASKSAAASCTRLS